MLPIKLSIALMLLSSALSAEQSVCTQTEVKKLTAAQSKPNDFFGFSMALSDDRLLVGAQGNSDETLSDTVTIFRQSGDEWVRETTIEVDDGVVGDDFGGSVALGPGLAVVGARRHDARGADAGAVYLFENDRLTWRRLNKLTASDAAPGDEFGYSVAIDGKTIAVGAPRKDSMGADAGAVYIFEDKGGEWQQTAVLLAPDRAPGDVFGISLSLSKDHILVGADLTDEGGENAGSAYIFEQIDGTWQFETKLTASDSDAGDLFGIRVKLNGDRALIGAARDDEAAENAGAAYIFERTNNGWQQDTKIVAPDATKDDRFGTRVAISGKTVIVGSILSNIAGTDVGAAYVFRQSDQSWQFTRKLIPSDGKTEDVFGWAVAVNGDTVAVGAPTFIVTKPGNAGGAYLYDLSAGGCAK